MIRADISSAKGGSLASLPINRLSILSFIAIA